MEDAFGFLHWMPEVFWNSTLTEYMAARTGLNRANGGDKSDAPSDDELANLVAKYG